MIQKIMIKGGQFVEIGYAPNPFGGEAAVDSDLKQACPYCSEVNCYADCDGSEEPLNRLESQNEMEDRRCFNSAIDGIESFIMAIYARGVVLPDDVLREALQTVCDALDNQFS
tara:strand:+ start:286 stop:624 length:339 start_codon:yes stop_codon:yes gene_type:complete